MAELERIRKELAQAERKLELMKQQQQQRQRPQPLPATRTHGQSTPSSHTVITPMSQYPAPVRVMTPTATGTMQHIPISPKEQQHYMRFGNGTDPLLAARAIAMANPPMRLPSTPCSPCTPDQSRTAMMITRQSPLGRCQQQQQPPQQRQKSQSASKPEPYVVQQLSRRVQQRATQIKQLQDELGPFLRNVKPTIPPQYSWSAIPVDHSSRLGALIGLEDTVQHVMAASDPALQEAYDRRWEQLASSNKPVCQHCHCDHATFWRAFLDENGQQVIVCENCDWQRVQQPFMQQYHKLVSSATTKAEQRRQEILQLCRVQQQEEHMLRDAHMQQ
ncbi:putative mediator of RNA polymerase II transcription subunit 8 [Sycon ciliatum]|uniref:putative mediator of RNA polymerase II transcription subunit 8 n=1 Tax=Sycon ciliatum TaxID=27933 RepID=UPI0020AA4ADA|eukprot:scpid75281/ scgid26964/ 